jgi:hypothetical protein
VEVLANVKPPPPPPVWFGKLVILLLLQWCGNVAKHHSLPSHDTAVGLASLVPPPPPPVITVKIGGRLTRLDFPRSGIVQNALVGGGGV